MLNNLLKSYKNKEDGWPPNLDALVAKGLIAQLPDHPYPDQTWRYDAATGSVE